MARSPRSDRAPARPGAPEGPRAATDHLILSPEEIVLEGPYVRQHVDEDELESLKQAILAGGEVKQAVGVRVEGEPGQPRYVLVYGMRRWLASKAAGLARIPVRNHGRLSPAESLALQVTENEARVDPHPVDTAVSYQLLVQEGGMSQAEIARVAGRSAAHVSYMRAVGEAILQLSAEEREVLYHLPEVTVPRFQKIAPLPSVAERLDALRELIRAADSEHRPAKRPATHFRAGPARGNSVWSVRLSYREEDLHRDPELAAKIERFLLEELERVRERVRPRTPHGGPRPPVIWEIESP